MEIEKTTKKEEAPKTSAVAKVTADVDVDFPSIGWAISAGATKELPVEETAKAQILANHHIKLIK